MVTNYTTAISYSANYAPSISTEVVWFVEQFYLADIRFNHSNDTNNHSASLTMPFKQFCSLAKMAHQTTKEEQLRQTMPAVANAYNTYQTMLALCTP